MWALEQHSAFIKALPELLLSNTDKNHRSCHIALSWATPCLLVHDEIQKYEKTHGEGQFRDHVVTSRAKKPAWYDNETKKLKGDWTEFTVTHLPEKRQQASPVGNILSLWNLAKRHRSAFIQDLAPRGYVIA